ncbi:MAG: hypothetical protein ACXAC8_03845 [Candidatus Hodarchaeales archaeon]|jgi:hypothetical protein
MANLKPIGRILGVIGGLVMIVFGIIVVVNNLLAELIVTLGMQDIVDLLSFNVVGNFIGSTAWIISAALMIVCGVIAIYGYQQLGSSRGKDGLLLWGIVYIVLGIVAGSVGALLILIGGLVLVIDYFI